MFLITAEILVSMAGGGELSMCW